MNLSLANSKVSQVVASIVCDKVQITNLAYSRVAKSGRVIFKAQENPDFCSPGMPVSFPDIPVSFPGMSENFPSRKSLKIIAEEKT